MKRSKFYKRILKWADVLFDWCFIALPIYCTIHFLGPWYLFITVPYLAMGGFIALFNDSGPLWLSYFMFYFWLPYFVIDGLIVSPICGILRILGLMKPKYTPNQVMLKHFKQDGREILERNNK